MKFSILFMMIFVCSTSAFAECYLCSEEKVTGFVYQKSTDEWVPASIKGGHQYLLKPLKKTDKTGEEEYGVYEAKKGTLLFRCNYWFADLGIAHCGNSNNDCQFKFKRGKDGTGKFISVDMGLGYFFDKPTVFGNV